MESLHAIKELAVTDAPLLLFECQLTSGAVERWSTHRVETGGDVYEARVLRHNLFEIRSGSEDGVDGVPRVAITLANADSHFSQIERLSGWKGAKLTVRFLFYDLLARAAVTDAAVVFQGTANPPDEITESTFRLSFTNRLSLQRVLLPEVRIQKRCPWIFPSTSEQRAESVSGGNKGRYSPFFRCGYSPDVPGGDGVLNGGAPFTFCDYTKPSCQQRGMYDSPNNRFGGIQYVPSAISVRSYGEKTSHQSPVLENEARYNDFVPLVYGTAWYEPPIVFARNDGNLTRMEVLLGMGEIQGVLKVVAHDIEIPQGYAGQNMSATGWFNLVNPGNRTGARNTDFLDAAGNPIGDPYGSMAVLSVVLPNRINDGRSLPRTRVLVEGMKLARYAADGSYIGDAFTNNPAWILLDVLRRSGWDADEIDLASFAATAAYCDELVTAADLFGNSVSIPRYQCNLVIRKRRSAAEVVRGIRNSAGLFLTYGLGGRLEVRPERTLAGQQPTKPEGSNSVASLNGGWPAYEFGDGTSGRGGILRKGDGEPRLRLWSRSTADTANRFTVEFQDAFNEYQQDSLSLVDVDDALRVGQEVTSGLAAIGLPNFDQAARIVQLELDKSIRGNTYVELETSVRGLGLKPGDLITLTYLKEGFQRQPFRILRVAPGVNYRTALIAAQIHDDAWYPDSSGVSPTGARRQPGQEGGLMPRPLVGILLSPEGDPMFEVTERTTEGADGTVSVTLSAGFSAPAKPALTKAGIPLVSLAATVNQTGGTLAGDQTLYYAVSATDGDGAETGLSFVVRATIPPGLATNTITLTGLSFSPETSSFSVYRGKNPSQLYRIAAAVGVANQFTDTGAVAELAGPPDENYDHANFYWRLEQQSEAGATVHGATTLGNEGLQMPANGYRGAVVRITKGKGAGQERSIVANTATVATVAPAWEIVPDATSFFVIAESGWRFGAMGYGSPIEFDVPNREGATVHISGRSANVNDKECAYELSPLTRWQIGGSAGSGGDSDVPPEPTFGITPAGQGTIELLGIGFDELTNTRSVTAGTLTIWYWDELAGTPATTLSTGIDSGVTTVDLSAAGGAGSADAIQIDSEVMVVLAVLNGGLSYDVERAGYGSQAAMHAADVKIYHLKKKTLVVPFVKEFFGSPASGSYAYPIYLPNARIAAVELFVTNSRGNSPTARKHFTATIDRGIRTLSGGQLSMQVEGNLAIQMNAVPPLIVEDPRAIRDLFATVSEAPLGASIDLELRQNGTLLCPALTIPTGSTESATVNGFGLGPLIARGELTLDIVSVGTDAPGRDLTVTIRL